MDKAQLAWLAGWLEGEGCFWIAGRGARIQGTTTDKDVAERAQRLAGGRLHSCQRSDRKLRWDWIVARRDEVEPLLQALQPWMGERRGAKVAELLAHLEAHPPILEFNPPHGTLARYRSRRFRCRCEPCRGANAKDQRRYRERTRT